MLGLSESCVFLISFYVAVSLRNIKNPVSPDLSESCDIHLLSYRNSMIGASLSVTSLIQHFGSFGDGVCSYVNAK